MLSACRAAASRLRSSHGAFSQAGNISPWLLRQQLGMATAGNETDSHDDFKPLVKAKKATKSLRDHIEQEIKDNPVMVYMKGVPDAPQCGFSAMVVRILNEYDVFINGEFVGGSDILINMHRTGELEKLLEQGKQQPAGKGN